MTDEEAFNILQVAEDMSHKNWKQLRFLYNNKFKEAECRIKELEAALQRIIDYGLVSSADLERALAALAGENANDD